MALGIIETAMQDCPDDLRVDVTRRLELLGADKQAELAEELLDENGDLHMVDGRATDEKGTPLLPGTFARLDAILPHVHDLIDREVL